MTAPTGQFKPRQLRARVRPGSLSPQDGERGCGTERELVTVGGGGRDWGLAPLLPPLRFFWKSEDDRSRSQVRALCQTTGRVPGVWLPGQRRCTPSSYRGVEGREPSRAGSSAPGPSRPLACLPCQSHGHFCLAGCVAGVVAWDVVQLFHGVVSA